MTTKADTKKSAKPAILTDAEQKQMLKETYSEALRWLHDRTQQRDGRGTGAAALILKSTREELCELLKSDASDDKVLTIRFEHELPTEKKTVE